MMDLCPVIDPVTRVRCRRPAGHPDVHVGNAGGHGPVRLVTWPAADAAERLADEVREWLDEEDR